MGQTAIALGFAKPERNQVGIVQSVPQGEQHFSNIDLRRKTNVVMDKLLAECNGFLTGHWQHLHSETFPAQDSVADGREGS